MSLDKRPTLSAPTPTSARALAPDLARGAMLLLIALANVHIYLHGHGVGVRGYPLEGSAADRAVSWVLMTFVDGRAYPLFALLFGYGLAQLTRRLTGQGAEPRTVVRLLRRRGAWLLLLGLVHAALLFSGDILGAYGLLGLVVAGLVVRGGGRRLLVVAGCLLAPLALLGMLQGLPLPSDAEAFLPSMVTTDPLLAAGLRVAEWVGLTTFMALSVAAAVLVGAWAARRRLLEEPDRHGRLLRGGAVAGLAVAVAGAQPMALMAAGVWAEPSLVAGMLAGGLHTVSGYAGGIGYVCLAGLVVRGLRSPGGRVVGPLVACGQRSLTCYLAQSVVFVAVLASYGGGLGDETGVAGAAVLAVVTWLATVALAVVLARRGVRGPFEVLLRRLTYGPRSAQGG